MYIAITAEFRHVSTILDRFDTLRHFSTGVVNLLEAGGANSLTNGDKVARSNVTPKKGRRPRLVDSPSTSDARTRAAEGACNCAPEAKITQPGMFVRTVSERPVALAI